jgi:hypothetical protein
LSLFRRIGIILTWNQKQYTNAYIQLDQIFEEEEFYWQQRSRLKWFLEGDKNTRFFFILLLIVDRKRIIFSLQIDGVTVYDISVLRKYVNDFYRSLLGQSSNKCISLSATF